MQGWRWSWWLLWSTCGNDFSGWHSGSIKVSGSDYMYLQKWWIGGGRCNNGSDRVVTTVGSGWVVDVVCVSCKDWIRTSLRYASSGDLALSMFFEILTREQCFSIHFSLVVTVTEQQWLIQKTLWHRSDNGELEPTLHWHRQGETVDANKAQRVGKMIKN